MTDTPRNQVEASAKAFASKHGTAPGAPQAQRDANAHLAPDAVAAYPVDSRGYTDDRGATRYLGKDPEKNSFLRKARHFGTGPRFVKIGRSVRYSYAELDRWLGETARSCTREPDADSRGDDSEAA